MSKEVKQTEEQTPSTVETREFTPTGIMLQRGDFQKDYAMLTGEGTTKIKVASVSREIPVLTKEGEQVYDNNSGAELFKRIINLKAIPDRHFATVKAVWGKRAEIDVAELRGLTMSINSIVQEDKEQDLPMNGSLVQVQTEYLRDEAGFKLNDDGQKVLVVKSFAVPSIARAPQFLLDDIEIGEEEEGK